MVKDMKKDMMHLTGVYKNEISIAPNPLAEARNERRVKSFKKEVESENEGFKNMIQHHPIECEKIKVEEALNLFRHRIGWKLMLESIILTPKVLYR